jgi:hypothetical protein
MPNTPGLVLKSSFLVLALASSALGQQRDTAFRWSKKLAEGARFAIRNLNGGIELRAGSTDQVEVRAVIRRTDSRTIAGDIAFDVRDRAADDVEICTVYRGVNACIPEDSWSDNNPSVQYIVDIPKGLRLRAVSGSGDVLVMQAVSEASIWTGSGDVVIRESTGSVSVTSGNGDVTIALGNGPVRATSGNGSVLVNTWSGPVNASSGNGNVDVRMISVLPGSDSMSISSGNGNVKVTLPPDYNGQLDASTGHHGVKTDFDVRTRVRDSNSRLRGSIGNGNGPLIKVHSGNGRVEIRKG